MKVPISVSNVNVKPDGTGELLIEFSDDAKRVLMKAWGIPVWDDARAQSEFLQAIRDRLVEESAL